LALFSVGQKYKDPKIKKFLMALPCVSAKLILTAIERFSFRNNVCTHSFMSAELWLTAI
jgi:hypothetical protein